MHQESLALGKQIDGSRIVASSLYSLGLAARYQGDLDRAAARLEESLRVYRDTGNRVGEAEALHGSALVASDRGDHERAAALMQESLRLLRGGATRLALARLLEGLAAVAAARRQFERSGRMFGTAAAVREAMGTPLPPADRPDYERRTLSAVRDGLGDEAFASAWAEGRAMTLEQAMEDASEEATGEGR